MAVGADLVDQALGDRAEDGVALRVAEGVVDRLEPVEIEEHDRARHIAGGRGAQASPSSWRTRPRLGRPDSTSMLARWVSRSCVWRISVMSLPTPRKPSNRPAVSMIGSPAIEIQRGPRAVLKLHFERVERLLFEQHAAELGIAAEQRRQRMAEQLAGRAAEQGGHPRADVGHAIFAIDLPQPAHAALLIFLQQQARAFALCAEIGIGLELLERPARDVEDAEDRDAEREQDRQHVLEGHACCGRGAGRRSGRR